MKHIDLSNLGFTDDFKEKADLYNNYYVGRVFSQYKDLYKVMCEYGEITAGISGKFRYESNIISDFPAVGDFVMLDRTDNKNGNAIIHYILPRKSAFIRKSAGTSNNEQVVANNIDIVFICMSLNNDFNIRRLERYLSISWESGAVPIIVLTKADLCHDIEQKLVEVESAAIGVDILVTSSMEKDGYSQIVPFIKQGITVAFIGSSGVGKSTLINRLTGKELMNTNGLRNDDKGKHTTTRRELILLDNCGMVIDTPGMRELGLEEADLNKTFKDIDELSLMCRFHDCTHTNEPGCAVQEAVKSGTLSIDRLESYKKLEKELKYNGLNSKQIENVKLNDMFKSIGGMKNARKHLKQIARKR